MTSNTGWFERRRQRYRFCQSLPQMFSSVGGGHDRLVLVHEEANKVVRQPAHQDQDDADQRDPGRVHLFLVPVHELKNQ